MKLFSALKTRRGRKDRPRPRRPLAFEGLEDRRLLATVIPTINDVVVTADGDLLTIDWRGSAVPLAGWTSTELFDSPIGGPTLSLSQGGSGVSVLETVLVSGIRRVKFLGSNAGDAFANSLNVSCEAWGYGGKDAFQGGPGRDEFYGGIGGDLFYGNGSFDRLEGNAGDDELHGGDGVDDVFGGIGNDKVYGDKGADLVFGGSDNDEVWGGSGSDRLFGGLGHDKLFGQWGEDILYGQGGNDQLHGGGDLTADLLIGGPGRDVFWTPFWKNYIEAELFHDFNSAEDHGILLWQDPGLAPFFP